MLERIFSIPGSIESITEPSEESAFELYVFEYYDLRKRRGLYGHVCFYHDAAEYYQPIQKRKKSEKDI